MSPPTMPNLAESIVKGREHITSATTSFTLLSTSILGFLAVADTIEAKSKELQQIEDKQKEKEDELNQKSGYLEAKEKRLNELERTLRQREKKITILVEIEKRMEANAALIPTLVNLNIRGSTYTIPKSDLLKFSGSYFDAMMKTNNPQLIDGKFFINRNAKLFEYVWEFITTGEMPSPPDDKTLQAVKAEFEFFNVPFPLGVFLPRDGVHGALVQKDHRKNLAISNWLPNRTFQLLYRSSVDGHTPAKFHEKCDNKGATLTIIRSSNNYLFGGYSPVPWDSTTYGWKTHADCFIFTLTNPPARYLLPQNNQHGIYCHIDYLPVFGNNDIYVNPDMNNTGWTSFPTDSTGKSNFTGDYSFQCSELEVYAVL